MKLTLHWRGAPLLAVDLTAQPPTDADNSLDPPIGLGASSEGLQGLAEPPATQVRKDGAALLTIRANRGGKLEVSAHINGQNHMSTTVVIEPEQAAWVRDLLNQYLGDQ